jgi:hypothetical protein
MPKNVRFGELVRNSGRPSVHTLWTKPGRDRAFTQAVKRNRVLTVVHDPTSKRKDYGEIGFHERHGASYLIFPRPLPKDGPAHVIGINYSLLAEARDF